MICPRRMIWMTSRRLDWALRLYGTELAVWPTAERDAALSLLRRCGQARQIMAAALAQEDAPTVDTALLATMQDRLRRRFAAPKPVPTIRWGGLAACALAGFYLGVVNLDTEQPDLFAAVQTIAIEAAL